MLGYKTEEATVCAEDKMGWLKKLSLALPTRAKRAVLHLLLPWDTAHQQGSDIWTRGYRMLWTFIPTPPFMVIYKLFLTNTFHFLRVGLKPRVFHCSGGPAWDNVSSLHKGSVFIKTSVILYSSLLLSNLRIKVTPRRVLWYDCLSICRLLASLKCILGPQKFSTSRVIKAFIL